VWSHRDEGIDIRAVKASYQNGNIELAEKPDGRRPVEVLVVFPETSDDPWEAILVKKTVGVLVAKFAEECLDGIRIGKAKRLKLKNL
jgi:hypothetical protein